MAPWGPKSGATNVAHKVDHQVKYPPHSSSYKSRRGTSLNTNLSAWNSMALNSTPFISNASPNFAFPALMSSQKALLAKWWSLLIKHQPRSPPVAWPALRRRRHTNRLVSVARKELEMDFSTRTERLHTSTIEAYFLDQRSLAKFISQADVQNDLMSNFDIVTHISRDGWDLSVWNRMNGKISQDYGGTPIAASIRNTFRFTGSRYAPIPSYHPIALTFPWMSLGFFFDGVFSEWRQADNTWFRPRFPGLGSSPAPPHNPDSSPTSLGKPFLVKNSVSLKNPVLQALCSG